MMPVRLCFENKKIISLSYKKEKNHSNRCEFWFFSTLFWWYTVCLHLIMQIHTHFIIINNLHLHKVHFRPQIAGASRGGRR